MTLGYWVNILCKQYAIYIFISHHTMTYDTEIITKFIFFLLVLYFKSK